jgi:D-alanyl-D-alanine-carboxypeptidase/D-alanyl-D-alanine-endopeptidase
MKLLSLAAAIAIALGAVQRASDPAREPDPAIRAVLADRVNAIEGRTGPIGIVAGIVDSSGRRIVSYGRTSAIGGTPPTGDTMFEIGSVAKVFTALVLADMAQHGEVALTDPVARYLPRGVRIPDRNGRAITLADLATHTSGLPFMPDAYPTVGGAHTYGPRDLYAFLARYKLTRDPGGDWEYSNIGYWLLGEALARRAAMPIDQLLLARVFRPLQMTSTTAHMSAALRRRLAAGYDASVHAAPAFDDLSIYSTLGAAAGGVYSSANDLLAFLAAAIGLDRSPLEDSLAAMLKTRRAIDDTQQALGWIVEGKTGAEYYFHEGGTWGYASAVAWDPAARRGVVVLSNQQDGVADIARHLLRPDMPLQPPTPLRHAEITLPPATMDRYAGRYTADGVGVFTIELDHGRLFLKAPADWGLPRFQLHTESAREFFVEEMPMHVTFQLDAKGRVAGALVYPPRGQRGISATKS